MYRVILCSASPRRRELLGKIIPSFEVMASDTQELSHYLRPHARVMDLAKAKGQSMKIDDVLLIAADTLVYRNGIYYGKPKDREDAFRMLRELSGKNHSVYTGVYLRYRGEEKLFYDKSEVYFKSLTAEEMEDYLDRYAPFDKAGAYGIQDGVVVSRYRGSFDNIMGLPTEKLESVLVEMGVANVYK